MKQLSLRKHPIPNRLNLAISLTQISLALFLLILSSKVENTYLYFALALIFAYVMQVGFFLMHEAGHNVLHQSRFINDGLGKVISALFPSTFILYKTGHKAHHRNNRSDTELYDYIRPSENPVLKIVLHYLLFFGLQWVGHWLMSIYVLIAPKRKAEDLIGKKAHYFDFTIKISKVTLFFEILLSVSILSSLFLIFDLDGHRILGFYAIFAVFFSSQQQIYHNKASRHIVEGSYDLRLPYGLNWLYLNSNFHLQHHRKAKVPWLYLSNMANGKTHSKPFLWHWAHILLPPSKLSSEDHAHE
jgi:fatty acid desaturase